MSGVFKRGASPSFKTFSPSLTREGEKGGRLPTNIYKRAFRNASRASSLKIVRGIGGYAPKYDSRVGGWEERGFVQKCLGNTLANVII